MKLQHRIFFKINLKINYRETREIYVKHKTK